MLNLALAKKIYESVNEREKKEHGIRITLSEARKFVLIPSDGLGWETYALQKAGITILYWSRRKSDIVRFYSTPL